MEITNNWIFAVIVAKLHNLCWYFWSINQNLKLLALNPFGNCLVCEWGNCEIETNLLFSIINCCIDRLRVEIAHEVIQQIDITTEKGEVEGNFWLHKLTQNYKYHANIAGQCKYRNFLSLFANQKSKSICQSENW